MRTYEVKRCPTHGSFSGLKCREVVERTRTRISYCHQEETVTAIDKRDVDPLVARVEEAITKLQMPRNQEPDAVSVHLQQALATFKKEEGAGEDG